MASGQCIAFTCTADEEGKRIERLLRDHCRDGADKARRLSNRLLKDAVKGWDAL